MHTPTSLFADMLGLLKELEFCTSAVEDSARYNDRCPMCLGCRQHFQSCHLQATIALAEEQVRIVGTDPTPT